MDEHVISIVKRHWLTTFKHIALEAPVRHECIIGELISAAHRHNLVFPIVDTHPLYSDIRDAFKAAKMGKHLEVIPSLMRPMERPMALTA